LPFFLVAIIFIDAIGISRATRTSITSMVAGLERDRRLQVSFQIDIVQMENGKKPWTF
jgi:undecaprenyl pyrophosphate phosphatase UppP